MLSYYNKLWWSAIADPDEYSTPDAGYIVVTQAGGAITGLAALQDYLFVFQERMYTVYQKRIGDVPISILYSKPFGCNSFQSIVEVNGSLFYLSSEGDIRVTNGVSDQSISEGIKELTKGIINGRSVSDYYGGSANTMPNALYDRYNNAYRLYYAGTSTKCDKCLTYFIDKGVWTQTTGTSVGSSAPAYDTTTYIGLVGNCDSSGITYNLVSKYGDTSKTGTFDTGWLSSGNPENEIKVRNIKVWVHAEPGQVAGDNCDCTVTVTSYNDPESSSSYATDSQSISYDGVADNLQLITFNSVSCLGRYIRFVLSDSGSKKNYSISKVSIAFEVLQTTN